MGRRDAFTFDEDAIRRIARETFAHERRASDNIPPPPYPLAVGGIPKRPIIFRNTSGEAIPAFACMRVTGAEMSAGEYVITVAKSSTAFQRIYLVNGRMRVGAASTCYGVGTWLDEASYILYDTGNTPAYGESWGPQDGTWTIKKYRYGFTIVGATSGSGSTSKVVAIQHQVNVVYGQTNGTHTKGSSSTIDLYDGNNAAISSTSITATNRFATVATAKKVMCTWIGGTWISSAAEC